MKKDLLFVGIDVDDKAYHAAVVDAERGEVQQFACAPNPLALSKKLNKFKDKTTLRICYEATYIGYSLQRALTTMGFACEIIAPSLIPTLPGKKVKTDKLDSLRLARYYAQGLLTTITIPDQEQEADRNVLRSRMFVLGEIKAIKNHISAYTKRLGWNFRQETKLKSYWTLTHRIWLDRKIAALNQASLQASLTHLLAMLKSNESTLKAFDQDIQEMAKKAIHAKQVIALKCLRGIDTHSALTIITELGDIKRFDHPARLTSYAGLDIIEHSSGGKERKFGISKMGNPHLRRILVEACQYALNPPRVSKHLAARRQEAAAPYIDIGDRCMHRLHKKGVKMLFRDKPRNKIKTACAREMLGFIWEALTRAA